MSNAAGAGGGAASSNEAITVVVRCRPMNRKETEEKRTNIIDVDTANRSIGIKNNNTGDDPKYFTFDATYNENTQQRIFYDESCFNIIESALEGFNATIFAYGQTGCGKSFTMQGPSTVDEDMRGVIPNSFYHIFQFVKSTKNVEFLIRCSYLELYNEEIHDLLLNQKNPNNQKCELKEDNNKGVYVKGLSDVVVESPEDLVKMFDRGLINRTTASTNMNSESSRSHSVFSIVIEMSTKDETTGKDMLRVGKLNLVDLAGSERAKKTGAKDQVLKEGIKINLSLTALGNVISALSEGGRHIPYRDSKLTRLLQDSLGGSAKTMMVAAISPADYNYEETLSTLRYANRAKNIKNKPKINEDPKDTMIREFKAEIERLKAMLMQQNSGALLAQLGVAMPAAGAMAPTPTANHSNQTNANRSPVSQKMPPAHTAATVPTPTTATGGGAGGYASVDTSSETFPGGTAHMIHKEMSETGNYSTDDFVETSHSNVASPHRTNNSNNAMKRTNTSSQENNEGYGTGEFEAYVPDNYDENNNDNDGANANNGNMDVVAEIRDEIEQRIHQLEHMLVNNHDQDALNSTVSIPISALDHDDNYNINNNNNNMIVEEDSSNIGYKSTKLSPLKSDKGPAAVINQAEEMAREAESIRTYKEKKQRAKQQKEAKLKQQQEEQQRQQLMQNNDDDFFDDTGTKNLHLQAQFQHVQVLDGDGTNGNPTNSGNTTATLEKKVQRLKKKYEKKINALTEELDEVREDFAYQRKQLMDAIVEQEKDTRLYESIARSLLSNERDLQKILDKCRYDEERDEWIVPFSKKKNVDHLFSADQQQNNNNNNMPSLAGPYNNNNYKNNNEVGSLSSRGSNSNNSSLLPDISATNANRYQQQINNTNNNNGNNANNLKPQPPNGQIPEKRSQKATKQANHKNGKKPKIPLLTLPGLLVSASALTSDNDDYDYNNNNNYDDENHNYYEENTHNNNNNQNYNYNNNNQGSSRSDHNSDRNEDSNHNNYNYNNYSSSSNNNNNHGGDYDGNAGISLPGIGTNGSSNAENKKKAKPKVPKSQTTTSASSNYTSSNNAKMPAIHSSNNNGIAVSSFDTYQNNNNNNNNNDNSYSTNDNNNNSNMMLDQAGSGEDAGPVEDWGFTIPAHHNNQNNNGNNNSKKNANNISNNLDDYGIYEDDAPEGETYSDDEDFVQNTNTNSSSNNNGNGNGGKKKKKKKSDKNNSNNSNNGKLSRQARNSRDNDDYVSSSGGGGSGGGGGMLPPIIGSTPRQGGGFSLPPI